MLTSLCVAEILLGGTQLAARLEVASKVFPSRSVARSEKPAMPVPAQKLLAMPASYAGTAP